MSAVMGTPRDMAILDAILNERILKRSEVRERFFAGTTHQVADARIRLLLNRFSNLLGEKRIGPRRESILMARPMAGVASTYLEHDSVVACIREALLHSVRGSTWHTEFALRTGRVVEIRGKEVSRIPDGLWVLNGGAVLAAVEYERTLKSRKRILEVVRAFENRMRCPFHRTLVFCGSRSMRLAYENVLASYFEAARVQATPRIRIFDLSAIEHPIGSPAWIATLAAVVQESLSEFIEKEIQYGKAS